MGTYYRINTSVTPNIATAIGLDQLSDMTTDLALRDAMTTLYGKNCSLVSALQPGEIFAPGGPLVYESVFIPGVADGSVAPPINCQYLNLKAVTPPGKSGAWGLDPNGQPEWVLTSLPPPPPPPPGPPSPWPTPYLTPTDNMRYLWEKFVQSGLGGPSPSYPTKP